MARTLMLTAVVASACAVVAAQVRLEYPPTRATDHVDVYHGTRVADPYRWLEDDMSAETAKWVQAQNAVTFGYLEQIPFRQQLRRRLEQLYNYPRYSVPTRKGEYSIVCTELCGLGHATMRAKARVVTQQEFDAWIEEQNA